MGNLNVVHYEYNPRDFTRDGVAADLQSKLRAATGGGGGDGSKVRALHIECVMGIFHIIVIYES